MLLTQESKTLHAARTGSPYVLTVHKDTLAVPRRFYCHWMLPGDEIQYDEKGKELKDDPNKQCCFNHRVGLPTRKWESDILPNAEIIPVELTRFNFRVMKNYFLHRKLSRNKCRGSGDSEILTIRYMIFKYGVLDTEKNRKCIILPGTSSKLSDEFSTRIKAVCDKIPQIYRRVPTSDKPKEFVYKTGGRIILTSATPDADRGFENVGDIDLEEVAHWELIDDMPVFYASEGVYEKTRCHIIHSTTPRGKANFYYNLVWSPDATGDDYYKHLTNWREIVGLPVMKIEDLYVYDTISDELLQQLREHLVERYHNDQVYHDWYENVEKSGVKMFYDNDKLIPIEQLVNVPIPILDINGIVSDSKTDRGYYDQELDNEFISGENRAIGTFQEEDIPSPDMAKILRDFKKQALE